MKHKPAKEIRYAEDIEIGSDYFGSPVVNVFQYVPPKTYLCKYVFTLANGERRELFSDTELS